MAKKAGLIGLLCILFAPSAFAAPHSLHVLGLVPKVVKDRIKGQLSDYPGKVQWNESTPASLEELMKLRLTRVSVWLDTSGQNYWKLSIYDHLGRGYLLRKVPKQETPGLAAESVAIIIRSTLDVLGQGGRLSAPLSLPSTPKVKLSPRSQKLTTATSTPSPWRAGISLDGKLAMNGSAPSWQHGFGISLFLQKNEVQWAVAAVISSPQLYESEQLSLNLSLYHLQAEFNYWPGKDTEIQFGMMFQVGGGLWVREVRQLPDGFTARERALIGAARVAGGLGLRFFLDPERRWALVLSGGAAWHIPQLQFGAQNDNSAQVLGELWAVQPWLRVQLASFWIP